MEVYLDLVALLNFLVDYLLLLGTNRLSGFPPESRRCLPAAALGGVYGGLCTVPSFRFLGSFLWRMVFLGLIAVIAFGWNRSAVKRCAVFVLLTMALGGIALSFGRAGFPALVLAAGGTWMLCSAAFADGIGDRSYIPLTLAWGDRREQVIALRDTGNTLTDPVTGEQVLVIGAEVAGRLTGLTREQLRDPLQTLTDRPIPGLRLIPYHGVGQGNGMLLALRFGDVRIGEKRRNAIVAFAPEGLGQEEMYQALTGGAI